MLLLLPLGSAVLHMAESNLLHLDRKRQMDVISCPRGKDLPVSIIARHPPLLPRSKQYMSVTQPRG